jgi:hypothetical protein
MNHDLLTRVMNRAVGHGYRRLIPSGLLGSISAAVARASAPFVFFNQTDYPSVASALRRQPSDLRLVHLSHGLDSTDWNIRHQVQRAQGGSVRLDRRDALMVGGKLEFEADYRRKLDASMCISPLDAELERWLGVPRTRWFTRPIRETPLDAHPVDGRVGCVATVDHGPNVQGLHALFDELRHDMPKNFSFRLVGGPEEAGRALAGRYPFVEYVGMLSDVQLRAEAATWSCFVHPIFAYARGCSTKCAVALGWAIPMATTVAGVRGYAWDPTILPLGSTASEVARMVIARSHVSRFDEHRRQTTAISNLQPSVDAIAADMKAFLLSLLPQPVSAVYSTRASSSR